VSRAKPLFSGKRLIFGQKPAAKNEKNTFVYFLNEKKRNSFRLASRSAQNPGFSLIIIGWGESGKVILQVSSFSGAVEIFFGQRWLSP